ncbi:MAG: hypothetical protein ACK6A9_16515 [Dolichospermum sp.]
MFPIPGGDAEAFIPAAVSYSSGFGLKNIIYPLSFATDIENQGRFCQYPPLFPWLVGFLMFHPTTESAFFILGIFSLISICLFVLLLIKIIKSVKTHIEYDSAIIASLMIFSYSGMILPMSGRPELLASIFLLLGAVIFAYSKNKIGSVLIGIIIGLLGATHIAGAIISIVILLLAQAYRFSCIKTVQFMLISSLVALVTAFTIIALSPNGLIDTLIGIRLHSKMQLERTDTGFFLILKYWIFGESGFFFGPIIIFSLLFFTFKSISVYIKNNTTIIYWMCLLTLAYLFYFFGFRSAPTNYNFILFQPIAYCIILYGLFENKPNNQHKTGRKYKSIVSLMLLISLVAPLRTSFLFFDYLNSGKTYQNARDQIQSLLPGDKYIFFTGSMWSLSEDYEKMWPWSTDIRKTFNYHGTESVLLQQEAKKPHFVPENGGLISDWRYLKKPLLFGLPIGNRPQGYGFSLWTISNR